MHLWTQVVGKVRLAQSPSVNHSWHATLYPTATGLTTSSVPYRMRAFQIDFNFLDHQLTVRSSDRGAAGFPLEPQSVLDFLQTTYEAAANLANWDRGSLERHRDPKS